MSIVLLAGSACASLVVPDTATPSSQFAGGFNGAAINTINGSGLPVGYGPSDPHAAYASGNHWTTATATNPLDGFIVWGFNSPQVLDAIYIWNHQSTQPPAGNAGYDVTLFDLTLRDGSNNLLLFLDNLSLSADTSTAQTFSLGGAVANVSSVRFDIEGVQSSPNFTGLAEVAFNSVPEPLRGRSQRVLSPCWPVSHASGAGASLLVSR